MANISPHLRRGERGGREGGGGGRGEGGGRNIRKKESTLCY